MNMKKIKNYISSKDLKINYFSRHLNVLNYDSIITLENDKVVLSKDNKLITIKGHDLSLLKLLEMEILIEGDIKTIEL